MMNMLKEFEAARELSIEALGVEMSRGPILIWAIETGLLTEAQAAQIMAELTSACSHELRKEIAGEAMALLLKKRPTPLQQEYARQALDGVTDLVYADWKRYHAKPRSQKAPQVSPMTGPAPLKETV